jgi:DNA-binding CsgD family transcriptional regulator
MKRGPASVRPDQEIDFRGAFENAPVGLALLHDRVIVACSHEFARMCRTEPRNLINQSFKMLYATQEDFELRGRHIAPLLAKHGRYSDDWIMKRMDGELFWCHVSGYAFDRKEPYAQVMWSFEDLSCERPVHSRIRASLTSRDRDVAALLIEGLTSKEIGRQLSISPRTVDIYRARLLTKFSVATTAELVKKLVTV